MADSKNKWKIKLVNYYPPYFFSGIKVIDINDDITQLTTQLKLAWYNKNLFDSHFGGSLYSMCDPFFVFIAVANLGDAYIVWDKSAKIKFKKPGYGKVTALFEISKEQLKKMKEEVDKEGKKTFFFTTQVTDSSNEVIAEIEKEVYIRRKDFVKPPNH